MTKFHFHLVLALILGLTASCLKENTPYNTAIIQLKWNQSYDNDQFEEAVLGLSWAYSYLGATNTNSLFNMPTNDGEISVNLTELGFNLSAENRLRELHEILQTSEEYEVHKAIDMGRYTALLIGASAHYYAITNVPEHFADLVSQYSLFPEAGLVSNSAITSKHRVLKFSNQAGLHQLFVTEERDPITGELLEIETLDLLPNGQPRFGIFDKYGNRKNAVFTDVSEGGKPAKCLWCHQSSIQPLFGPQEDLDGYLNYILLRDTLYHYRSQLQGKQNTLADGVDFSDQSAHVQLELLYIGFMEPSAQRLSLEWKLSKKKVLKILEGIPTHTNEEFPFLGTLYNRNEIESFAPFRSLQVSSSVREFSAVEVDYLGD